MSNSRIYVVRASDSTCRLVRAANQVQAVRHAAKAEFTAAVATQDDLVELLPTHKVEEAAATESEAA